jgi:hypothetical protein
MPPNNPFRFGRNRENSAHEDDQRAALKRKTYIPSGEIHKHGGLIVIEKDVEIVLDKIVGGPRGESSWALDGSVKRLQDGSTIESLEYAKQLARDRAYAQKTENSITLYPFIDESGSEWYGVEDGVHRIMAAKVNNEPFVLADIKRPADVSEVSYYPGTIEAA